MPKKDLFAVALVLWSGGSAWTQDASPASALRPSFLFVYADDQRWDALSAVQREQGERGRFPWLETPNLDRLAAGGVRFRNAFVVCALCSPSRAAFLTGRYNHQNGVANNHTPFPAGQATVASLLRAAGYKTGYVGKWHMGQDKGQRPGFDHSASYIAHGRYDDCPFEVNGERRETKGWVDDVSTDFAIEFLKESRGKPFLLMVGYKSPHGPFTPPERLAKKYAEAEPRPVPNLSAVAPYRGKFAPPRQEKKAKNKKKKEAQADSGGAPSGPRPEMVRNYFRTITGIDENVGRLLAALDELALAEDTVVVYSSDNGFYLGEHGLGDKRSAYDEAMRIPLLWRYPRLGGKGRTIDAMALNIDLAPTFLDLAGVAPPASIQGRSWRPILEGKPADWRRSFLYEYFYERNFAVPTVLAVRTQAAKLIRYPGHDDWTEVYDLKADPYETRNLAADPERKKLLDELQAELDRQSKAVEFKAPESADKEPEGSRS